MKKIFTMLPFFLLSPLAQASSAYGSLGNFDAVNDTGETCYGFEIEIDDIHSTSIGGTYSYNHYGTPKIWEDNSDPSHSKVFIRYEAPHPSGLVSGFTNPAVPGTIHANGHSCTNPTVNQGCEHFGVGVYGSTATAYKYNWLVKNASGQVVIGPPVNVSSPPTWSYQAPVFDPNNPAIVQIPAQVVAVIPAPFVPIPPAKQYGEPSFVKVIKTTSHNANHLELEELVGDDHNNDERPDWTNGEPDEIESEWHLLQTNNRADEKKSDLAGNADEIGDGKEIVTRRYEFYGYAAGNLSIDGENGEAKCDEVASDGIHGVGTVTVTNSAGNDYEFDCSAVVVVGEYQGAQMAEFNGAAPLSIIKEIQSGMVGEAFPGRAVVYGGNTPYFASTTGNLPNGLTLDSETGVLSGIPGKVGESNFTVSASDADGKSVNQTFTLKISGRGDVDNDYDIDSTDISVIKSKIGQVVQVNDPADMNGDLKVNLLDYRKAAALCTKPQCAIVNP